MIHCAHFDGKGYPCAHVGMAIGISRSISFCSRCRRPVCPEHARLATRKRPFAFGPPAIVCDGTVCQNCLDREKDETLDKKCREA